MIFRIADYCHRTTITSYNVTLGHGLGRIVGTFRVYIRSEQEYQLLDRWLVKYRYGIHHSQSSDDLSSLVLGDIGPARAFQRSDLRVRIDGDDQRPAELPGTGQISNMAGMDQVKTAIGQQYPRARGAPLSREIRQLAAMQYRCRSICHKMLQADAPGGANAGTDRIDSKSSAIEIEAVPFFITTNPPA